MLAVVPSAHSVRQAPPTLHLGRVFRSVSEYVLWLVGVQRSVLTWGVHVSPTWDVQPFPRVPERKKQ